ncbi:hypothetical protein ES705_39853 [subsurface metagenome]
MAISPAIVAVFLGESSHASIVPSGSIVSGTDLPSLKRFRISQYLGALKQ